MSEGVKRQVPVLVSLLTYFGMLFGALALLAGSGLLTNADATAMSLQLALVFPFGLGLLFSGTGSQTIVFGLVFVSYASFIAFLVAFIRARTWATCGLLYFGFAILLLLNIAGCRSMQKGLSDNTMGPNKSTAGKGGIAAPFHTGRAWPALPESYCWAKGMQ